MLLGYALLVLAVLGPAPSGARQEAETHVDELRGLQVDVPAGWRTVEQEQDGGFTLYLVPPDTAGEVLVAFTVRPLADGEGVDALVERALAKIASDPAYSRLERFSTELLGSTRPALRVRMRRADGELAVEAAFLAEGGRGYVIQRAAPPADLERWSPELARVVATFAPVAPSAETESRLRLRALAERCGDEVDWAASWEEAARRARELGRPVLVVAWLYGGFALPYTPRTTTFMDEDVLALVATRFVPWWYRPGERSAFAERYGLSGTGFGQALLVATPDGEVLAETERASDPEFAHAFLCRALAAHPRASRAPHRAGGSALDRARQEVARGELDAALARLADAHGAEESLLLARVQRLRRDGPAARAALERARALAPEPAPELERALLAEEARLFLRLAEPARAREACTALLERHGDTTEADEAMLLLALADAAAGEHGAARERCLALIDARPESRWSAQAAALLAGGWLDLGLPVDPGFPDERVFAEGLVLPQPEPLAPARARTARDSALAWLLAAQREDGSWISPTELSSAQEGPSPFVDAITALATRALLAHAGEPGVDAAVTRALGFLSASIARRARTPTRVLYMDYTPWSDAALLDVLVSATEAGAGDADELRAAAAEVVSDLAARAQPHGGWGYYVTGDLDGPGAPPTSMSFTTAAVVLALARARAAGIDVPHALLEEGGIAALAAMRDDAGVFAYSSGPGGGRGVAAGMEPGAAGRAPVCELALLRAGASDERRVERALEQFLAHAATLADEQGKVLMHAGPAAQGCHYVLFDYAWAAAAWRAVDGGPKTRVRLIELLMGCRQADGSFLDTSINGRAYGTAMALLALDALDD